MAYSEAIEAERRHAAATGSIQPVAIDSYVGMMQQRRAFESVGGRAQSGDILTIESDGSKSIRTVQESGWIDQMEAFRREHHKLVGWVAGLA